MYMETPKGEEGGEQLDAINLRTLRGLVSAVKDRQSKKSEVRNPKSETSTKSKTRK
jgi:hypothetical protein